jgi:DNA-binding Lrp family transcriptional regulator
MFIDDHILKSGRFDANEIAVLAIISSYSNCCTITQSELAKMINKSVPTVKRTIKSLIEKGVITKEYTLFKKCILKLVSLQEQAKLMTPSGIINQVIKVIKNRKFKEKPFNENKPFNFSDLLPSMPKPKTNLELEKERFKQLYAPWEPIGF